MNSKKKLNKEDIRFKVDTTTMSYLEALHFDFTGYEHIMKNILLKHKDNPNYEYNTDTCEIFMGKYMECSRKYNILKSELIREYVPDDLKNENFIFDFESEYIVLDKKTECVGDSCGCKY